MTDIEGLSRREKMLKLREELLAAEKDRLDGQTGVSPEELNSYLEIIIEGVAPAIDMPTIPHI